MGWIAYHRPDGENDREQFQRELFTNTDDEIVKCASKNNVFYAAVRTESTGEVRALVVLMRHVSGERNFNFNYKDLEESAGPVAAEAPAEVLDALTPTDNEYALDWRKRCRENLIAKQPPIT